MTDGVSAQPASRGSLGIGLVGYAFAPAGWQRIPLGR